MKKLLATVCALALLAFAAPESVAMPVMHGALKGNTVIGSASPMYKGAFSTAATQTTFSWSTVDLGTVSSDRKVGIFITSRVSGGGVSVASCTIAGRTAYYTHRRESTDNQIEFWVAEVPEGTTNQTISITFEAAVSQASIIVYSLYATGSIAPVEMLDGATDNVAIASFVPAKGVVLCGLVAQSGAGSVLWTNATEDVDAVYTGSTIHSAASYTSATEVASRSITADVSGAPTEIARLNISLVSYSPKPYIYQNYYETVNSSAQTTYTFSGIDIGPPTADRRVLVYAFAYLSAGRYVSSVKLNSVEGTAVYSETGHSLTVSARAAIRTITTGTTVSVEVSCSASANDLGIIVMVLHGVVSETPYSSERQRGTSPSTICTINVPETGLIVSFTHMAQNSNQTLTYTNITEKFEDVIAGLNFGMGYNLRMGVESNRAITAGWADGNHKMQWAASFL